VVLVAVAVAAAAVVDARVVGWIDAPKPNNI